MISENLTFEEIIFIHEIIEKTFKLPKGHIKVGDLETLIEKVKQFHFHKKAWCTKGKNSK